MLISMGFTEELAALAARLAHGTGVEGALNIIETNPDLLEQQYEALDPACPQLQVSPRQGAETLGTLASLNPSALHSSLGKLRGELVSQERLQPLASDGYRRNMSTGSSPKSVPRDDVPHPDVLLKAVFVVRADLGMTPGKMAAQVTHAALDLVRQNEAANSFYKSVGGDSRDDFLAQWLGTGEKVVILQCEDLVEMKALQEKAGHMQLFCSVVRDAGRTEVEPGTQTVVGFGPHYEDVVNQLTGHLQLLR